MFVYKNVYSVERNSEVWHAMWKELAAQPINLGNRVCENEVTGDCWEYMGSIGNEHNFRHRAHPTTKKRELFIVKLSKELASS